MLEPGNGPAEYARENWTKPEEAWLAWTVNPGVTRATPPQTLCHIFTERPIYRPEEPVHIKGYVRSYQGGVLSYAKGGGTLVVTGPGGQEWRLPVAIDETGNVYQKFDAPTPATGDYLVKFEPDAAPKAKGDQADADNDSDANANASDQGPTSCGDFPFKKEAYRLPTFEVLLNAPETVPLEGEFSVDLLARYFAGGLVAGRPVKWRASQFPYAWTPPGREGWFFSTDARFSSDGKFKSTPVLEREANLDDARRGEDQLRSFGRADGAAAPLSDRGDRRRRGRCRGAQPDLRRRAAGLRARRQDAALSAKAGADRRAEFSPSTPRARRSKGSR